MPNSSQLIDQSPLDGKIPNFLAKIIVKAIKETSWAGRYENYSENLKKLISLRFYAYNLTYSYFLEKLTEKETAKIRRV